MKFKMLKFAVLLLLLFVAACGDSGDTDSEDGDLHEDGDGSTDGDLPDDGDVDGDEDGEDGDDDGEIGPGGTKCKINRHNPDRDILSDDGGITQICDPEDELDGTGVEIGSDELYGDIHLTIRKVADLTVEGWVPVGPAVEFKATALDSSEEVLLETDVRFRIPFVEDMLSEDAVNYHINVVMQLDPEHGVVSGDGNPPFFLPKTPSSIAIDNNKEMLGFDNYYFGTYQAMIPEDILPSEQRRFTYRAFAGISMGATPASLTGMKYADHFDILGPMGGLMDMSHLLYRIYHFNMGGFCTYDEITNGGQATPEEINAFVTNPEIECGYCGLQHNAEDWHNPIRKCFMVPPREMYNQYGSKHTDLSEVLQNEEHAQGYNHWYYDINGGTFDRTNYTEIYRDLTYSFGSMSSYNRESPYFASGLTGDRLQKYLDDVYFQDETTGCKNLQKLMVSDTTHEQYDADYSDPILNFVDAEYNPTGQYPVILFCDGDGKPKEDPMGGDYLIYWNYEDCGIDGLCDEDEPGYDAETNPDPAGDNYNQQTNPTGSENNNRWDENEPGQYEYNDPQWQSRRMDFALAVDFNGNGIRDYGEPVIRQFWEPYEDCGIDGLCDEDEPGYDAETNPDPAGDDYNPYTNPAGKEGNWRWEEGESYQDVGIDGVDDTCPWEDRDDPVACPYDYGEGNGRFDMTPGAANFVADDPRTRIETIEEEELRRLNIWMDGGIRDLFNFLLESDGLAGALNTRLADEGHPTAIYEGFTSLQTPRPDSLGEFRFLKVNYDQIGKNVVVRYGNHEASTSDVDGGDGRHVGIPSQVVFRVQTFYSFCNTHFPNGDFEPVDNYDATELLQNDRFYSESLKREQKYSVALPPGYYTNNVEGGSGQPDICTDRYPVIYLSHGYGMTPEDFAPAIVILFGYMEQGIFQKVISVFPDGKCESPGLCRDDCERACISDPNEAQCRQDCEADRDCANVHRECFRGTFYQNHVATMDDPMGQDQVDGVPRAQIEDSMIDLIEYIDENYCTRPEETLQVDGKTLDALY